MQRLISRAKRIVPTLQQVSYAPQGCALSRHFSTASNEDSHDDFKPQVRAAPAASVESQIQQDIDSHDVFIYMKGVPKAPMCGFSNMACAILNLYSVDYGARNVLADAELREGIKRFTSWPTIPQIFIKGEFVGGSDILHEMHQKGELKQALEGVKKAQ